MNKKLTLIIGLQALLIVILFWMLIFYGKDEYDNFRTEQGEEIEGANRVTENEGFNIVTLSPEVQKNSGISTSKIKETSFKVSVKSFGNVVSIDSLIEAKAKYLSLQADIASARVVSDQNLKQYQRLKTLNADDRNVSDHAVQEALAQVEADKARITASELQAKNLLTSTKLQWGETLAKLALGDKTPQHLDSLINRNNVLVQVSLPGSTNPTAGDTIRILPLNESAAPIKALYVSPATQADSNSIGKTFYYSAPAERLRIGMRVSIETSSTAGASSEGAIVPGNAVVWYAGKPWAYFKQGNNQFLRRPISADTEIDNGWFNKGLRGDSEVVTSGAQLLLSEEFKYQIKNENED